MKETFSIVRVFAALLVCADPSFARDRLSKQPAETPAETWKRIETALLAGNLSTPKDFIGRTVQFEGGRMPSDKPSLLLVGLAPNDKVFQVWCRVRNSTPSTRQIKRWSAFLVGVRVKGAVRAIDTATNSVEVDPIEAQMLYAQ